MRKILRTQLIILVPIVILSLSLVSCDDSNQARRSGTTTISGSVGGPFVVSIPPRKKETFLTKIKKLFSIIKPADAQGDEIEVEASQNGVIVDSAFVVNGMYAVEVPSGGPVKLDYITSDETFSVEINVTPSSEVVLDVDLELSSVGPVVDIQRFDITSPNIVTKEDESFLFNEPHANLTIEGGGEDCIRSTGNSLDLNRTNVEITVDEVILTGCGHCIFTDSNQRVELKTAKNESSTSVFPPDEGEILCSASGDGVRAEESSTLKVVNENRDGAITIISSEGAGVRASGVGTVVDIEPGSLGCLINASEAVIAEDGATVNADCQLPLPAPGAGGGCDLSGAQVVTKNQFGFGKYVFDVNPPNAQGMIIGYFLLTAECGNDQPCPPFWVHWSDNQAEVDFEFVPGWNHDNDRDRPRILNGSDCSADNANCNVQLITDTVSRPQPFVSLNTFAKDSSGKTRASDHQAFYEMSSSPFGRRDTYTIYYTPCGVQWSIASEQGDAPLLYQNSAHINDNQDENTNVGLRNFIHTVDFDNMRGKSLNIYLNYYNGINTGGFAGNVIPPPDTRTDIHSVQFFPIQGGDACSTASNPVGGAACSIDSNNKITCSYSTSPTFKSDFENGMFELNGNQVGSWTDQWTNVDFPFSPISTKAANAVYNGTGNPLELHFRCP